MKAMVSSWFVRYCSHFRVTVSLSVWAAFILVSMLAEPLRGAESAPAARRPLPKIRIGPDGRSFLDSQGRAFVPFGVNYYRPGTGWAPQVWKQFDAEATRRDFVRMKELGVNCVRVFLSYGSFYQEPGVLMRGGLAKFDQFLAIAEAAGIYVHPTGLDHWEGTPEWARTDRIADEKNLAALEFFWKLFAARYRGRTALFAYDLRNEPEVAWNTAPLLAKWNQWLEKRYHTADQMAAAWGITNQNFAWGNVPVPEAKNAPGNRRLLDYQVFREGIADDWTRRQVVAIKSVDPAALVTVGLIQWSVPALLPGVQHYAAFRPNRQAKYLDFLEIHFYPLDHGAYEYRGIEDEQRHLAYLESVVREVARGAKPVVIAEFGWYGGGQPTFDQGRHPAATEAQQAQWGRRLIETTEGLATGWLNWGFYDQPEARDVSQLTGLLTADGRLKEWGRTFRELAARLESQKFVPITMGSRPELDWAACLTSVAAGNQFRSNYFQAFHR
jgi:hypothetical protein